MPQHKTNTQILDAIEPALCCPSARETAQRSSGIGHLVRKMTRWSVATQWLLLLLAQTAFPGNAGGQETVVPHNQDQVPNEPMSAADAAAAMTVPEGFGVEVVASEPQLVNPVAMVFDHRGRIWVTESVEYPRLSAGEGQDRIKILEDTDGDGQIDDVKIFAEGLNIPSGIALGHGGVWVANSPDILFLQDTDGDDKADRREVIVSGFGRFDTHELPNSLTWGPDGYLYGLNGVFNNADIQHHGKQYQFTCAMFRIDPITHQFEIFAEGTSNPWGITFDRKGEAFISACVIDHLWHISQSGYYLRQAGAYPPHTWAIDSIVDHKHYKAAYCGIEYFDSPAYPPEFRDQLYMGNIHGASINADRVTDLGSTYRAQDSGDILQANDVWFMPVAQKTGPDGSLYLLDWYDRYHCYQDANRDPAGIDRLKGRLYRLRYADTPRKFGFDLQQESDAELIEKLGDANLYFRNQAQRILCERILNQTMTPPGLENLHELSCSEVASEESSLKSNQDSRRHALWAIISARSVPVSLWKRWTQSQDSVVRSWAIRAAGNFAFSENRELSSDWQTVLAEQQTQLAQDRDPGVRRELIIALGKNQPPGFIDSMLLAATGEQPDDGLLPRLLWQNLFPKLVADPTSITTLFQSQRFFEFRFLDSLAPRIANVLLDKKDLSASINLAVSLAKHGHPDAQKNVLLALEKRMVNGEIEPEKLQAERVGLQELTTVNSGQNEVLNRILAMSGDPQAQGELLALFSQQQADTSTRQAAFAAVCFVIKRQAADSSSMLSQCLAAAETQIRSQPQQEITQFVIDNLGQLSSPEVAQALLRVSGDLDPATRARVVETVTTRTEWAKLLFQRLGDPEFAIKSENINQHQISRLLASNDTILNELIAAKWGTLATGNRGLKIDEMLRVRRIVHQEIGDIDRGWLVYDRVCGQCHQLGGRGQKVGPDIDANGRASLSQLLSNMVDPNLVIGSDYQGRMVETVDGRVFSGLVVEDNAERLVLNTQGGHVVSLPRDQIEQEKTSPNSLMPEGQTQQMTDQEIADLMALLVQNDVRNREAGVIPEAKNYTRNEWSTERFAEVLPAAFAGFSTQQWIEGGLGVLTHQGRNSVLRTHPEPNEAIVLRRSVELPSGPTKLRLGVSHHPAGDWQLVVRVNGTIVADQLVDEASCINGWMDLEIDLSEFAGQGVEIELLNQANGQQFEFGYWSHAYLIQTIAQK